MKSSFPTVVTLITVLVSASAESTFLSGGSLNHEDGTNFNHRALRGDAESMAKEEESQAQKPTRQLDKCWGDGVLCFNLNSCVDMCCNGYHFGDLGIETYCGPQTSCWGKNTLCVPGSSCTKCCNSWSWYLSGPYCD